MARQKSGLLSAMGTAFEIVKAMVDEVLNLGGSDDDLRRILTEPKLRKKIAELIVKIKHIIDLDADPFLPEGWQVEEHKKGGQLEWDPTKVKLYLSENQRNNRVIQGNKLRAELANQPVLNANVLDYLLAHPELIPEECKGKAVFFWGTIYRNSDGVLCVRCLYWIGGGWRWHYSRWLGDGWYVDGPAALRASN